MKDDTLAPKGFLWICVACGKFSRDKYGSHPEKSSGWDESCMLNSILADKNEIFWNDTKDRVISIGSPIIKVEE